jgi:hypothetical protein
MLDGAYDLCVQCIRWIKHLNHVKQKNKTSLSSPVIRKTFNFFVEKNFLEMKNIGMTGSAKWNGLTLPHTSLKAGTWILVNSFRAVFSNSESPQRTIKHIWYFNVKLDLKTRTLWLKRLEHSLCESLEEKQTNEKYDMCTSISGLRGDIKGG